MWLQTNWAAVMTQCVCVFGKFHPSRERSLLIPADRCHSGLVGATRIKSGCFESERGRENRVCESHKNLWESDCFVATDLQSRVTSPVGCYCVCVYVWVHFTVYLADWSPQRNLDDITDKEVHLQPCASSSKYLEAALWGAECGIRLNAQTLIEIRWRLFSGWRTFLYQHISPFLHHLWTHIRKKLRSIYIKHQCGASNRIRHSEQNHISFTDFADLCKYSTESTRLRAGKLVFFKCVCVCVQ